MSLSAIVEQLSSPLQPLPTRLEPRFSPLANIQAVIFDVYGTLLISASGDIGNAADQGRADAFSAAIEATCVNTTLNPNDGVERLHAAIKNQQAELRNGGIEIPEVDIAQAWAEVVANDAIDREQLRRLAVEYECRVNPIWPMPSAIELVKAIGASDMQMGIISNAQFFTPIALAQLFGGDLPGLGFHTELCVYSFEERHAKPGERLYELAKNKLRDIGLTAEDTLYVGNDMLNDIMPAKTLGFRTALFAGDQRSLRMRTDDPRVQNVAPDWVITDFAQMFEPLNLS